MTRFEQIAEALIAAQVTLIAAQVQEIAARRTAVAAADTHVTARASSDTHGALRESRGRVSRPSVRNRQWNSVRAHSPNAAARLAARYEPRRVRRRVVQ